MATNNGKHLPALSDETVKELLSVQKQELAIRFEEIKRDNAEIDLNKNVAKQSIEAQERDRKHEREERTKRLQNQHYLTALVLVLVLFFAGFCIYVKETAVLLDLAKLAFGFAAGMGYQAYKSNKKSLAQFDDD